MRGRLGVGAFVVLALALTTFDLFKAGMGYNPAIPQSHAVQPATPAMRYLQDRSPQRFSALQVTSALSLVYPFAPNTAMRYQVQDVRGYVIPTEERYFDLWRDVIHRKDGCYYLFCTQAPPADDRSYRALALLGVGNLLQHPRDPPLAGRRPAYEGADAASIATRPRCRGRSWWIASRSSTAPRRPAIRPPRPASRPGRWR